MNWKVLLLLLTLISFVYADEKSDFKALYKNFFHKNETKQQQAKDKLQTLGSDGAKLLITAANRRWGSKNKIWK